MIPTTVVLQNQSTATTKSWNRQSVVPGSIKPINGSITSVHDSSASTINSSDLFETVKTNHPDNDANNRSMIHNVHRDRRRSEGGQHSVNDKHHDPTTVGVHGHGHGHGHNSHDAMKFANFEASVSDAWSLDDCLINPAAAQSSAETVLKQHNLSLGPSHHSSRHAKTQAMQRLATQKEPLPSGSNSPTSTTQTGSSLYPKLAEFSSEVTTTSRGNIVDLLTAEEAKYQRIERLLNSRTIDLDQLRKECWKGVPHKLRPIAWRILSGYLPSNSAHMESALKRKREDYFNFVQQYFHTRHDEQHQDTFRQIHIDIPRMCPLMPLFQQKIVQEIFERVLYIWAIRHPASGYVQGINDLVTPFFVVFLSEYVEANKEVGSVAVSELPRHQREAVEADSFWCVSLLLDTIQDNYTFAQPGIQMKVRMLEHLVSRVENQLHLHLIKHQVEYLQFAFRWMNNLLMREIPLRATIRLWDTYLSENNGFAEFHVYVCAAFLRMWSRQIRQERDFQNVMILLQNLPTQSWSDRQISELTADAFSLMSLFAGSKNHLQFIKPPPKPQV